MKQQNKIWSIPLAVALCLGMVLPAAAIDTDKVGTTVSSQSGAATVAGFDDVHEDDYYAEAVQWAQANGVTYGTSSNTFSPKDTVTRAQAMTFLWIAAGRPEPSSNLSPFADVRSSTAYYYKPVLWAAELGITSGVDATHFGVDNTLTYEQILAFLCRAAGGTISGDWSQSAQNWAKEYGLTDGLSFNPKSGCPRADIVTYLYRGFGQGDIQIAVRPIDTTTNTTADDILTVNISSEPTLANDKSITDDNVREIIYGLQSDYPEGMHWTNDNSYYSEAVRLIGSGCAGFALICSDAAFGDLPVSSTHSDFDAIRVGDMVRVNHDTHTVIVLEKRSDSIIVAEGNYNSSIHWGREISRQSLIDGEFVVTSRYPTQA
jgi:hypothetical protein